jgi:beta-lactam-binding protein with PASTA domain
MAQLRFSVGSFGRHVTRLAMIGALCGIVLALTGASYPIPGCTVPRVAGKALGAAESALTSADCAVGAITTAKSATVASGDVISSSPAAGTKHHAGTQVNLKVSIGNPPAPVAGKLCKVPKLVGDTVARAAKAIEKANCSVGKITTATSSKPVGKVISSSPRAGTKKGAGAKVNLKVSKGKKKKKK